MPQPECYVVLKFPPPKKLVQYILLTFCFVLCIYEGRYIHTLAYVYWSEDNSVLSFYYMSPFTVWILALKVNLFGDKCLNWLYHLTGPSTLSLDSASFRFLGHGQEKARFFDRLWHECLLIKIPTESLFLSETLCMRLQAQHLRASLNIVLNASIFIFTNQNCMVSSITIASFLGTISLY